MSDKTPDVSGFTRNEKFIMESLTSLQSSVVELRDRTSRCETRLESVEAELSSDSHDHQTSIEKLRARNQLIVALIGGILTLIGLTIAALAK